MIIAIVLITIALIYLAWFIREEWDNIPPYIPSQDIYYDPSLNQLFQVKKKSITSMVCGGMSNYYGDAQTAIDRQRLSPFYLLHCKRVFNVDKCDFLHHDGINWKVKKEK